VLLALLAGLVLAGAPIAAGTVAANSVYSANCTANLRASASTSGTLVGSISQGTTVVATGTVAGSAWTATCGSSTLSGSTWYAITVVAGVSTTTRYGLSVVYSATGLYTLAPPPPPPGGVLEGLDVSQWQGTIDWSGVAYAGKAFVIMKASEGQTFADPKYAANHAGARAYGIRVGAYHFAAPDTSPNDAIIEADSFVQKMAILPGDLNPALDLEQTGGLNTADLQAWVGAWLNEVYAKLGMRPMIYTSPSFWSSHMGNTSLFAVQGYTVLWIAHWFVSAPTVPASNWGGHGWTFWQYTDCGHVLGISGCVDLDRYNGTDLTAVTYAPSWSVSGSPTSVKQGATGAMTINISRQYFTLPVTLSVSGLPDGATATLDADTTTASSMTLHVTTSNTGTITPVGTHDLTITATADGVTKTAIGKLTIVDGFAPTVTPPYPGLWSGTTTSTTSPLLERWSGSDDSSGIASYGLQVAVNGGSFSTVGLSPAAAVSALRAPTFNAVYQYRVRAQDWAGNISGWAYGQPFKLMLTQQTSSYVAYSSGWATSYTTAAMGGSLKYTSSSGAWASYSFSGAGIQWVAYRGPNRGSARVYIDGTLVATISLYSSTYQSKRIVFVSTWGGSGWHTIRIVNMATAGHPRIDLDGFVRLVLT
jgi:GH25 family lysozyme M1 (1,4-beta-N-acetylmuramidase)